MRLMVCREWGKPRYQGTQTFLAQEGATHLPACRSCRRDVLAGREWDRGATRVIVKIYVNSHP